MMGMSKALKSKKHHPQEWIRPLIYLLLVSLNTKESIVFLPIFLIHFNNLRNPVNGVIF